MRPEADLHPLAQKYLQHLGGAARSLPSGARGKLLADIEAHLREATSPTMTDAEVLEQIDKLGDPDEIVAQAALSVNGINGASGTAPRNGRGAHEWAAILLLMFGGFFFGIGWLIGVLLLWTSARWTTRDRVIGTLLPPFGMAGVFVGLGIGVGETSSSTTCWGTATPIGGTGTRLSATPVGTQTNTAMHCTSSGGSTSLEQIIVVAIFVVLVVASIVTPIYLARRANRLVIN